MSCTKEKRKLLRNFHVTNYIQIIYKKSHQKKYTAEKIIITDEKKQPTYIHIYVNYYSSVKQGKLVQFITHNSQIFKKVYLQILKFFIYTPKHHHDPF